MKRTPQTFSYSHAATILNVTRPVLLRCLRDNGALLPNDTGPKPWVVEAGYIQTYHDQITIAETIRKPYRSGRVTVQGLAWLDQLLNQTTAKAA